VKASPAELGGLHVVLEGINLADVSKILPWRACFSYQVLTNVILPARFEKKSRNNSNTDISEKIGAKKLPRHAYTGLLNSLKSLISSLQPPASVKTIWQDYPLTNNYEKVEACQKREFIHDFVESSKPDILWDIGCNTGEYSEIALSAGARLVVGFEYDQGALGLSYQRAQNNKLNFLPLYMDLANPSPSQGWNQIERFGLYERRCGDALIALAIIHHLCIGRNIPVNDVVLWLVNLAPTGIIEFIPKEDPMVQDLVRLREDIFTNYSMQQFEKALSSVAKINNTEIITKSGRKLYCYTRN